MFLIRMILYFPVSSLVTLFGNILQNPMDPRAKSDARLMGLVVTFLSMLGQEAEQGGVHRMLGVCSEFVRIAKVVIDRAEKEQTSRRKRKTADGKSGKSKVSDITTSEVPIPTTFEELSPPLRSGRSASFGPVAASSPSPEKASPANTTKSGYSQADYLQQQQQLPPQNGEFDSYGSMDDMMGLSGNPSPGMPMSGVFQQPLLPPDLFALPMTLDWNWAEMSGGAYPSVENGNYDSMNFQYDQPQQ